VKPATWHWFAIKGDDPRPMFAFPGLWRRYIGPVKKDGASVDIETYAFPTTPPNPLVATIDHEPMPVLFTRAAESSTLGYAVHPWKRAHWAANAHQSACGLSRGFFKEDREGLVEPANAPLTSV
jgi:putative SOS response-associated peptidase YedK